MACEALVCMDKGMLKSRLPDHLDQQICKPKKGMGNCMLIVLLVLEDSVSLCLYSQGHLMEH